MKNLEYSHHKHHGKDITEGHFWEHFQDLIPNFKEENVDKEGKSAKKKNVEWAVYEGLTDLAYILKGKAQINNKENFGRIKEFGNDFYESFINVHDIRKYRDSSRMFSERKRIQEKGLRHVCNYFGIYVVRGNIKNHMASYDSMVTLLAYLMFATTCNRASGVPKVLCSGANGFTNTTYNNDKFDTKGTLQRSAALRHEYGMCTDEECGKDWKLLHQRFNLRCRL